MQLQTNSETEKAQTNPSRNKIFTVPNILSFCRLAMIPLIVYCYIWLENSLLTAGLLLLSGITDVADGIIARTFNMVSELGKALDPIADKLTQAVVLVCFISKFPYVLAAVVVFAVKEILNGLGNLRLMRSTGKVHGALWHGKISTALLYIVMFIHIIWYTIPPTLSYILISLCIAVMLLSSVLYTIRNIKSRKENLK